MTDQPVQPLPPPAPGPLLYDGQNQPGYSSYSTYAYGEGGPLLGTLDIARVIRVVRRKWRLVLLVLLFCLGTGIFYLTRTDPIYRASSLLELSVRRPRVLAQQEAVIEDQGQGQRAEEFFNTRLERLKGDTLASNVVQRLKGLDPKGEKSENELRSLAKSVNLSLIRRTRLVQIVCDNKDAELAALVCNAFADAAQASVYDESRTSADAAVMWLKTQALAQKKELEAAEAVLLKYRQENNIDALESQRKTIEESMLIFNKAMSEAKAEYSSLLARYTPKHPTVTAVEKTLENLNAEMEKKSKLASELELTIVERRMHLSALDRNQNACDASYRSILNRIQEARLSADENTAIIKCVEPARVPTKPVKPRWTMVFGLAFMLGLFGGVVLALGADKLEDRVSSLQDIDFNWGLTLLGSIPRVAVSNRRELVLTSLKDPSSQIAEAIAGLRAMLDSAQYRDHSKVILLASSQPEEGKTTMACNLAGSCAGNGQRTLLIDFDLRRPRLAGIFPMPPEHDSLLEYIAHGKVHAFDKLVYKTEYPGLFVIASKPIRNSAPAHAVGDAKVKDLLAWARKNFDRVVIDAPPLGLISDALVLGGLADCVLLVIRQDHSRRRLIHHTVERMREAGIGNIAGVLNDVDFSRASYGSPYYHYSKHYEAYRNSPEDADATKEAGKSTPKS